MSIKRAEPRRALDETRREASRAKCARELLQAPLDSDAGEDHEMSEDASKLHACLLLLEPEKRAAIVPSLLVDDAHSQKRRVDPDALGREVARLHQQGKYAQAVEPAKRLLAIAPLQRGS